jgi:hypothetical protein
MTGRALRAGLAVALFWVSACRGETTRDVRPIPASSQPDSSASSEIIPLDQVKKSQAGVLHQKVANTEITITYNRPVARGRTLFGGIVPYDEVWNPGADEATTIAFTRDVHINGLALSASKYSLWAIPRPVDWTIIFSKAADVYHTPYPGETQDALRLDVRAEYGTHMETLAFDFPVVEGKDALLRLSWGDVIVPLSISVP